MASQQEIRCEENRESKEGYSKIKVQTITVGMGKRVSTIRLHVYSSPKRNENKSKNSLLACHTRRQCSIETSCNSIKVKFGIKVIKMGVKRKRKRSDSVLWQKSLHRQKNPNSNYCDNAKRPRKNFDYTTIADRLKTVSWGNDSHPTCVVKPVYGIPTSPTYHKSRVIKRTQHSKICK